MLVIMLLMLSICTSLASFTLVAVTEFGILCSNSFHVSLHLSLTLILN